MQCPHLMIEHMGFIGLNKAAVALGLTTSNTALIPSEHF